MLSPSVMSDSLVTSWTAACQAPLFMEFPGQEHWSGLTFLPPINSVCVCVCVCVCMYVCVCIFKVETHTGQEHWSGLTFLPPINCVCVCMCVCVCI